MFIFRVLRNKKSVAYSSGGKEKKENSVPISRVLFHNNLSAVAAPAIYPVRGSPHVSSIPPSVGIGRTGNPQTTVYANLQPPDGTAR